MQFFKSMQDTVFSVLAPMQGPEAQLELGVSQGNVGDVQRVLAENPGIDPGRVRSGGRTMLMVACAAGKVEMVRFLRSNYQFDVHEKTPEGENLLHLAARAGNLELVQLLVSDGVSAAARNRARRTPYDVVPNAFPKVRQFLLPLVFESERKDGTAPALPPGVTRSQEDTRRQYAEASGAAVPTPTYTGPPPPTGVPGPGRAADPNQPFRLPGNYDGFGTSEARGFGGRPLAVAEPPPTAVQAPTPSQGGPRRHAYVAYTPSQGIGAAYAPRTSSGAAGPGAAASRPGGYAASMPVAQHGGGAAANFFIPQTQPGAAQPGAAQSGAAQPGAYGQNPPPQPQFSPQQGQHQPYGAPQHSPYAQGSPSPAAGMHGAPRFG